MARRKKYKKQLNIYEKRLLSNTQTRGLVRPPKGGSGPVVSVDVEEYERSLVTNEQRNSDRDAEPVIGAGEIHHAPQSHETPAREKVDLPSLFREINNATIAELELAWTSREGSDMTRQEAYEVFSRIRYLKGIDEQRRSYAELEFHPALAPFEPHAHQSVGDEVGAPNPIPGPVARGKRQAMQMQTVREGQARFRERLISYYGLRCMVTGETLGEVIEAAHIDPYDGERSNSLDNGLLLRVDVHRLFDRGLIAIEPDSLKIIVSEELANTGYGAFNGSRIILDVDRRMNTDALRRQCKESGLSG